MKKNQNENGPMMMIRLDIERKADELKMFKREMRQSWNAGWPESWKKPSPQQAEIIAKMEAEIKADKQQYRRMAKA